MPHPAATALAITLLLSAAATAAPIPKTFESMPPDRQAIQTLLASYTKAVSTKNQTLFESLLLSKNITFAPAPAGKSPITSTELQNYAAFSKGVFQGAPFSQRFQDVHIAQDGPLANVSLVFVNTMGNQSSWGWKTMLLLKVQGTWKIASELYTGHRFP